MIISIQLQENLLFRGLEQWAQNEKFSISSSLSANVHRYEPMQWLRLIPIDFGCTAIWTEWEAPIHSIQLELRYNTIVLANVYESHDIRLEWHIRWHRRTVCQIICANRFLPP